jgi:hypothetical protein
MLAGIEGAIAGLARLLASLEQFTDHTVFNHQAAGSVEVVGSEDGEGVFDPDTCSSH